MDYVVDTMCQQICASSYWSHTVCWVLCSGSGAPNPPPSNEKESAGPQVLSPEEAAQLMLPTILNLKPSDSGKLLNNDGTVLPY